MHTSCISTNIFLLQSEIQTVIDDHDVLNEYAALDLLTQFRESQHYHFYVLNDVTFYVRRFTANPTITSTSPPRFDRTRIVRVEQTIDEKRFITCSCGYYERNRRPCRHIYSILDRNPNAIDCDLRNLKIFSAHFTNAEQFTQLCNDHWITDMRKGMLVSLPIIMNKENRSHHLSFFEDPLNNITLLNPICDQLFEMDEDFGYVVDDILQEGCDSMMDLENISQSSNCKEVAFKGGARNNLNSYKPLHSLFFTNV